MNQAGHAYSGHMPSSGRGMVISAWLTGVQAFIFALYAKMYGAT